VKGEESEPMEFRHGTHRLSLFTSGDGKAQRRDDPQVRRPSRQSIQLNPSSTREVSRELSYSVVLFSIPGNHRQYAFPVFYASRRRTA
jgi:hypothetical protein